MSKEQQNLDKTIIKAKGRMDERRMYSVQRTKVEWTKGEVNLKNRTFLKVFRILLYRLSNFFVKMLAWFNIFL